jgi:hypothetical protein
VSRLVGSEMCIRDRRELVASRVTSGEQDELAALTLACSTILASDAAVMSR